MDAVNPLNIVLEDVADGTVIDGLRPGYLIVSSAVRPRLEQKSADGSLYPYAVRYKGVYCCDGDYHLYEVIDWPGDPDGHCVT